jgi:hypothetical protein
LRLSRLLEHQKLHFLLLEARVESSLFHRSQMNGKGRKLIMVSL